MKILFALRPEIFSVLVMLFMVIYDRYCSRYRSEKDLFFRFSMVGLGHCVFALITEITVNSPGIPTIVNNVCHILFFLFSLLYSLFYFEYALEQVILLEQPKKRIMRVGYLLSLLCVVVMCFSPIEYIQGTETRYSAGTGPTLCYMLGFLMFIGADVILIVNHRHISRAIVYALLPISLISMVLLMAQVLVPEFLMTAQSLTLTALGLFLAIENPVGRFRDRAFIDANAHIWNRNCYEYDMAHIVAEKEQAGARVTCVMGDVNGLKCVNDRLGHLEGDRLLASVARIWQEKMQHAYRVYRVGGDEFMAFYFDTDMETVRAEIDAVEAACNRIDMGPAVPVGISMGYAEPVSGEEIREAFRRAEAFMYINKKRYYEESGMDRRQA